MQDSARAIGFTKRLSMVGSLGLSTLDSDTHGRRQGDKASRVAHPLVPALDRLGERMYNLWTYGQMHANNPTWRCRLRHLNSIGPLSLVLERSPRNGLWSLKPTNKSRCPWPAAASGPAMPRCHADVGTTRTSGGLVVVCAELPEEATESGSRLLTSHRWGN